MATAIPDLATQIALYESDMLGEDEIITLFQRLVDNGFAWKLQGHYGRTAQRLINAGLISTK